LTGFGSLRGFDIGSRRAN
jgi:uncharacterized protein (DUF1330 family)